MTNAIKDQNNIPVVLGVSYVDGVTLVPIEVDSVTGGVEIDDVNTVSTAAMDAARDGNHVTTMMAVDSVGGDPIPVFVNPTTGGVLIGAV